MLVGEFRLEAVDLLHRHAAARSGLLPQQGTTALVAGGDEHEISFHDRRGDHGRRLVDRIGPEKFPRLGIDGEGPGSSGLDIDLPPINFGADDRRVAGAAIALHGAAPQRPARLLVEGDHRGLLAAGRAHEALAVDRHALAVAPRVALRAAKLRLEIDAILLPAVGRRAGDELAERRDDVDGVAIDCGRAARTLPVFLAIVPRAAGLCLPELLARGTIEAGEVFVCVPGRGEPVAERVDPVARDRQARVAAAGTSRLPDERRSIGGPRLEQVGVGGDGRAPGSAERRPVGGRSIGEPAHEDPPRHHAAARPRRTTHRLALQVRVARFTSRKPRWSVRPRPRVGQPPARRYTRTQSVSREHP